ncbi:G-patch-domain Zn-finger DNA-binding protein [Favolaschia claudopus]|uniref:G-patch-domain Zn-finger DNA-binding protein n=1 Tax=Favolaschia claudopus TaxID=2862362 RepID=A0AAW0EI06_9AGAR
MSSETIARWNAIPLEREAGALKRPRPEDDDSDDDISIVSRTPSPPPTDQMDIDKYDEYVSRPAPEVITVETKIKPTNKGFAMLAKLGWVEGQPLGVSGDGRVDPVPFQIKRDSTGLGKWTQDARMIETTVSQRRGMDSEKMTKETEEQRKAREDHVARRTVLESELSTTIKAFYCDLCEKQFKTVVAYTEHTNSYAHHHKARFKDMQANVRIPQDDLDKRKEKERKREEKELRKIAAANGIKMPKPAAAVFLPLAPAQPVGLDSSMDIDGVPLSTPGSSASGSGFKKLGWATVSSSNPPTPPPPPPQSTVPPVLSSTRHPDFRAAGWTSLESGSSQSVPPPPPPSAAPPPPPDNTSLPPPRPAAGGWATVSSTSTDSNRSRWTTATPSGGGWSNSSSTPGIANASSAPPHPPSISATPPPLPPLAVDPPTSKASAARSGWQQFQKAASKRR